MPPEKPYLRLAGIAGFVIAVGISLGWIMPTLEELSVTFSVFAGSVCLWLSR